MTKYIANVPGPGTYAAKEIIGRDGPSKTMGSKEHYSPERKEGKLKPGPGNYNPSTNYSRKKEPAFKIGSEIRKDLQFEKTSKY